LPERELPAKKVRGGCYRSKTRKKEKKSEEAATEQRPEKKKKRARRLLPNKDLGVH